MESPRSVQHLVFPKLKYRKLRETIFKVLFFIFQHINFAVLIWKQVETNNKFIFNQVQVGAP